MTRLRPYHDAIATIACLGMFWTLGTAIGDFTPSTSSPRRPG
jgi:hypothetical protein